MTADPKREPSAVERAERLVKRVGDEAARITRSAVARTEELAEDIWAEAQSVRKPPPKR